MDYFEKIVRLSTEFDKNVKKQMYSNAASKLFEALWNLDDMDLLRPLAMALNVSDKNSREYFYSWKGLLFYVYNYNEAFRFLKDAIIHVKQIALSDGFEDRQKLTIQLRAIIREKTTLKNFLDTYYFAFESAFITRSNAKPFLRILNDARFIFWSLGTLIGQLDLYTTYFAEMIGKTPSGQSAKDVREFLNEMEK